MEIPSLAPNDQAWSEVAAASATELELRATAGPESGGRNHPRHLPPTAPRVWTGSSSLLAPGSVASFKLYSLTAEGHERGSNSVTITRPA